MLTKDHKPFHRSPSRSSELTLASLADNAILRRVNGAEAARIVEVAEWIEMPTRFAIYRAGEVITAVFFPIDCVLSVVTRMKDGGEIEVGTIGREGTSGIPLLMGGATTANDSYCQVPGWAIKMPVEYFHHLRTTSRPFSALLDRYLQAYVNFLGQLAGCNRLHSVYERCSRWLLLTHDRVGRDEIFLTHEYLAMMLGSRRSGVTIALAALQRAGYIQYAHGCITMLDRPGLESTTCECYAVAQQQFAGFLRETNEPEIDSQTAI